MNYDYYVDRDGNIFSSWQAYILNIPMNKKENTMNTAQKEVIRAIVDTQAKLDQLKNELAKLDNPYGEDTWPLDTVMRFRMKYDAYGYSKGYTFAVIKTAAGWYPSGKLGRTGSKARTWDELCANWKEYFVKPENIQVLRTHETLGEPPF